MKQKVSVTLVVKAVTSFPEQKQYGLLAVYLNACGCLPSMAQGNLEGFQQFYRDSFIVIQDVFGARNWCVGSELGPRALGRRCHTEQAALLLIPGSALCCLPCNEVITWSWCKVFLHSAVLKHYLKVRCPLLRKKSGRIGKCFLLGKNMENLWGIKIISTPCQALSANEVVALLCYKLSAFCCRGKKKILKYMV